MWSRVLRSKGSVLLTMALIGSNVAACRKEPPSPAPPPVVQSAPVSSLPGDVASRWVEFTYERVRWERINPVVASRIYGYMGLTLHEALVAGSPGESALSATLNGFPALPAAAPGPHDWPVVLAGAMDTLLHLLFSAQSVTTSAAITNLRTRIVDERVTAGIAPEIIERSLSHGRNVAKAIWKRALADGFPTSRTLPYQAPSGSNVWTPTEGGTVKPLEPFWGTLRPFALARADSCAPPPAHEYSEKKGSPFRNDAEAVYRASQALTTEQREIAFYWSDGPGETGTPPGHWMLIARSMVKEHQLSLDAAVRVYALTAVALADAFISCWQEKFHSNVIRPETYIARVINQHWAPLLPTPPFPEYTSGHSVVSGSASAVLTHLFGDHAAFTDVPEIIHGIGPRHFDSFEAAAKEAGISRLYGGIHYPAAIENGLTQGRCVGENVWKQLGKTVAVAGQ